MAVPRFRFSKRTKIVAASTLATFFVIGGFYNLYHSNYHLPQAKPQTEKGLTNALGNTSSTTGSNNVTTASAYTGWKTDKTINKLGLKYPGTWFSAKDVPGGEASPNATFFSDEKVKLPGMISKAGIFATVSLTPKTNLPDDIDNIMFKSPVGKVTLSSGNGIVDSSQIFTKLQDLKIAGYSAVLYTNDSSSIVPNSPNYDVVYTIDKGSNYYKVDFFMNKNNESNFTNQIQQLINSIQLAN